MLMDPLPTSHRTTQHNSCITEQRMRPKETGQLRHGMYAMLRETLVVQHAASHSSQRTRHPVTLSHARPAHVARDCGPTPP